MTLSKRKEFLLWLLTLLLIFIIGMGHGFFRKTQLAKTQPTIVWAVTGYVMPQPLEEYLENLYGVKIQFREIKTFQDFRTLFSTSDLVIAPLHWIEALQREKLLRRLDDLILENANLAPEFTPFTVGDTTLPLFWDIYKYAANTSTQKPEVLANPDLLWTWLNANRFKQNSSDWTEVNAWAPHIASVASAGFEKISALENLDDKAKENYAFLWMTAVTIPAHSIYKSLGTKLLFEISRKDLLLGWTSAHKTGTCFEHLKDSSIKNFYQPETIRELSLARLLEVQKIPSSAESAMLEAFRHSKYFAEGKSKIGAEGKSKAAAEGKSKIPTESKSKTVVEGKSKATTESKPQSATGTKKVPEAKPKASTLLPKSSTETQLKTRDDETASEVPSENIPQQPEESKPEAPEESGSKSSDESDLNKTEN